MKNRTLVISDIHGCLDEFHSLLALVNYDPSMDQLVLLGDYVDRGGQSKEVLEEVSRMVRECGVIAIKGNHDQRFVDLINTEDDRVIIKFFEHGGEATFRSYAGLSSGEMEVQAFREHVKMHYSHHIAFLEELPLYHEDNRHIYVHAGLHPKYEHWREQPDHDFMYIKELFWRNPTVVNKTVVFGHTKTVDIHGTPEIWFGGDKIGLDGGCAYGYQLNCLEITSDNRYATYRITKKDR